jgi:diguanylate cyclase (GGDEF)-like protein
MHAPRLPGTANTANTANAATAAAAAKRLVIGMLVALATLPPLLTGVIGGWFERQSAAGQATVIAWAAAAGPVPDADALRRLAAAVAEGGRAAGWIGLLEARGELRAQSGPPLPWPSIEVTQWLPTPHAGLAGVRVARPLGPVLAHASVAALGGAALAIVLWWLVFRRPVSTLQRAEGHIRSHSRLDGLTGLLNREGLRLRMARALERTRPQGTTVGVVVLDLDRFNLVNGTLGQAGGDLMLRGVAERLRGVVGRADAVARITGDQFAILLERISSPQVLSAMVRNVLRAFELPFVLEGRELVLALSAGGALADDSTLSVDDLLRRAGAAMRAAKAAGGARLRLYEPAMDDDAQQRLDLDLQLRRALTAGQFFLVYQPIVEAREGRVVAVEALLRWAAPERGLVSPAEFIPVLEETGLIVTVGHWVLQEACRRGALWQREGHAALVLSVNISPRQFAEPDFVERVRGALLSTGFAAQRLQLEVTEGLLLEPTPETQRRIAMLAELGVRLAVDDFGMGYSSLAYLKRFPLHALKIDRLFVRDIARRAQDLAIVRAIVDLGHGLGLEVTAEGVETPEQWQALRGVGCDWLQGFLFARPSAAEELMLADAPQPPAAAQPAAQPSAQPDALAAA